MKKHLSPILVLLIFSYIGLNSMMMGPLYSAHDIWHNIARFSHYFDALKDGVFPPYWIANMTFEYGYPLFFFSFPFPWIFGSIFLFAGFSIPLAFKLIVILSFFFSGLFMYFFVQTLTKNRLAATLSGVLYLWAPYHFLTVYISSAVGTMFVFTFLPSLMLGIYLMLFDKSSKTGIAFTTLSGAIIILSHLLTIIYILPLIFLLTLGFLIKENQFKSFKFYRRILTSAVLTFLICAFYLIPAIYYSQFTQIRDVGGFSDIYKNSFVNFSQLVYSKWGTGPITKYAKDGEISFQIGIAQWLSMLGLFITIFLVKRKQKIFNILLLLASFITIFLMLDYSSPIWDMLTKVIAIDYPFRALLASVFIGSLAGGLFLSQIKNTKIQYVLFVILIGTALYTNKYHDKVIMYITAPYTDFVYSETTTNTFNEYSPKLTAPLFKDMPRPKVSENVKLNSFKQNTYQSIYDIDATESGTIFVGQFAFPGQTLYLDGVKTEYTPDQVGRISLYVNEGIHNIKVIFEQTSLILVSKLLTLLGLISLGIILLWPKIKKS